MQPKVQKRSCVPNELNGRISLDVVVHAQITVEIAIDLAEEDLRGGGGSLLELGLQLLTVTAPGGVELDDGVDVLQRGIEGSGREDVHLRLALVSELTELVGNEISN